MHLHCVVVAFAVCFGLPKKFHVDQGPPFSSGPLGLL